MEPLDLAFVVALVLYHWSKEQYFIIFKSSAHKDMLEKGFSNMQEI